MKYFFILTILLAYVVLMTGCATKRSEVKRNPHLFKATIAAASDPLFPFDQSPYIAVIPDKKSNEIQNKHYVSFVAQMIRETGQENVYTYDQIDSVQHLFDIAVVVKIDQKNSTFNYEAPRYGMKNNGTSTVSCSRFGNSVDCTEKQGQTLGVIGTTTNTSTMSIVSAATYWMRLNEKEQFLDRVAYAIGMATDPSCSNRTAIYQTLFANSIGELSSNRIVREEFVLGVPQQFKCD